MTGLRKVSLILVLTVALGGVLGVAWNSVRTTSAGERQAGLARARSDLTTALSSQGLALGAPVFMRIFKEESLLEVWLQRAADGNWVLARRYPICNYSGKLGPKLREGDRQSPEGLYAIGHDQLHPGSRYHLAFNLGFPNAFDRANGRTGSFLMVHGDCVSIGCYAMTNRGIEEIYALAEAALKAGQKSFDVHAYPARLTDAWIARHDQSPWIEFWRDLKSCHDRFETTHKPPRWRLEKKRYHCSI